MRTYADISHFRAPYKNWPSLSGEGLLSGEGFPAPEVPAIITEASGVREFTPAAAKIILGAMSAWSVVLVPTTMDSVNLEPAVPGDLREKASEWIDRRWTSTIIAGTTGGAHYFLSGGVPVGRYLTAVKPTKEAEVAATVSGQGAVLKRPVSLFAKLGPVGVTAVALVAVGAVVLVMKKKKRATPNRRRSW
jgi:hypothetical protein